jgi:alanine racemase
MVMNPETVTFDLLVEHNLEPELFSPAILQSFVTYLSKNAIIQYPVHIKIDTGMHRLGFDRSQLPQMIEVIMQGNALVVTSVFSHLAASENPLHDAFTNHQAQEFDAACSLLAEQLPYAFIRHLSNTSAIVRHPNLQYDMVRLGIGLYGVDTTFNPKIHLQTVLNLRSTIAQLRTVKAGDTVGYSLAGALTRDSLIATIRIGYADGFSRNLGNGKGYVWIKGTLAPVVGNVCMDMIMVDVTDIDTVSEGDVVELFGPNLPVTDHAKWSNTIAYEVLTGISQRVKRVYFEE